MASDDVIYVCLLITSIGLGKVMRLIPPELSNGAKTFKRRRIFSTLAGLAIALYVSGGHVLHLFATILVNSLIVLHTDYRRCHLSSFVFSFLYLMFFRLSDQFGLPSPPPHTNAIIMILTLKLVGLAFEVNDTKTRLAADSPNFSDISPSFSDIVQYGLSHVGLLTGPYYKFRTFHGLFSDPWNPAVSGVEERRLDSAMWRRLRPVPFYVVAFLVSGYFFPLSVVNTTEWQENTSLLWKLFYMTPIFFNFRMRIYSGFVLSECSCIMSGLGSFPSVTSPRPGQGPSKPELLQDVMDKDSAETENCQIDFETVHNIDEWGSDFVPTMREALKCWNMTVQHWLVVVVYKRFPFKPLRTVAVMLVSSVWHGVYSGYYLSLGSVPLVLVVEDLYRRVLRSRLSTTGSRYYDWLSWFTRMQWFSYLGMGFLLLKVDLTLTYWSNIYYMGHLVLPAFYLLGLGVIGPIAKVILPRTDKTD